MSLVLSILFSISISASASAYDLTYSNLNRNIYVGTGRQNYALTGSTLAELNIDTVTVNGDSITITVPTCQTTISSYHSISSQLRAILENLKEEGSNKGNYSAGSSLWIDNGKDQSVMRTSISRNNPNSNFFLSKTMQSFHPHDSHIPNLARIILEGPIITYLYYNGIVDMKPIDCLSEEERKYVEDYKSKNTLKKLTPEEEEALMKRLEEDRQRRVSEQKIREAEQMKRQEELQQNLAKAAEERQRQQAERKRQQAERQEQLRLRLDQAAEERQRQQAERKRQQAERQEQLRLRLDQAAEERQRKQIERQKQG